MPILLIFFKTKAVTILYSNKMTTFAPDLRETHHSDMGKSCTASSLRILQDGNVAKVVGCSGAM